MAALLLFDLIASAIVGCGSGSTHDPIPISGPSTTPGFSLSSTPAPSSSPTPSATPLPISPTPSESAAPPVIVLAQNLHAPDDLVLAPDGGIYFSDVVDGTVSRLDADGMVTTVLSNLARPEGLVLLPDGSMVVAEQGRNRLSRFDLTSGEAFPPFLELPNDTGHPGVDNILFDPTSQTLIVPDSPNGTLLRVDVEGRILQTLAHGLARPVGAAVEADGSLLVPEEKAGAIVRIPAQGGTPQVVAQVAKADDVVVDEQGNIYAVAEGEDAVYQIDANTGAVHVLLSGLGGPQGIILDTDGNLVITDPGHNRIIKVIVR